MHIRRVTLSPTAIDVLKHLDKKCFPEDSPYPKKPRNGEWWWVAYSDTNPVAFLVASKHGKRCMLERVGVLPEARGNGLQRRLMAVCEQAMRRAECSLIVSYTAPTNAPSINSFINRGWKSYTPRLKVPSDYKWVYWRKRLL